MLDQAAQEEDTFPARYIYDFVIANFATLSKDQYASRVVETTVITMPKEPFEQLCSIFLDKRTKKLKIFRDCMFDQYGNYIAPKLVEKSKLFGLNKYYEHFIKCFQEN